jgi:hypothetical protein
MNSIKKNRYWRNEKELISLNMTQSSYVGSFNISHVICKLCKNAIIIEQTLCKRKGERDVAFLDMSDMKEIKPLKRESRKPED